jgi:predicted metalloprotease with PDZ domain
METLLIYLGIAVVAGFVGAGIVLWVDKLITPKTKEDVAFDNTMTELHEKHDKEQQTITEALDKMLEEAKDG